MPVVVTGASGLVGRAVIPGLVERSTEVRAVVRRRAAAEPLRVLGAKVAVTDLSDTDVLAAVMADAHTVCHLVGGMDLSDEREYESVNLGTTRDVLSAARRAKVTRILFMSYPGASPDSANAYLRAKGVAEEEIRASGLQHAIVRSTHVYGSGSRWLEQMVATAARRPLAAVVGPGTQRVAPVFVADVAAVLVAADDRAARVAGTFGLQGPDVVTADELVTLLAGRRRRILHLSVEGARRLAPMIRRSWSTTMLELLATDCLAEPPLVGSEFAVEPTPLADGLAASGFATGAISAKGASRT